MNNPQFLKVYCSKCGDGPYHTDKTVEDTLCEKCFTKMLKKKIEERNKK